MVKRRGGVERGEKERSAGVTEAGSRRRTLTIALSHHPTEIKEDVAEECGKFGKVVTLKIPRPVEGKEVEGVGKVRCDGNGERRERKKEQRAWQASK